MLYYYGKLTLGGVQAMNNCPFCDKSIDDSLNVCPYCGRRLDESAPLEVRESPDGGKRYDPNRTKKRKNIERYIFWAAIIAAVFIVKATAGSSNGVYIYLALLIFILLLPVVFKIIDRI